MAIILNIIRLSIAYKKYLRFDWPVATVVATQLILALIVVIVILNVPTGLTDYWGEALGLRGVRFSRWRGLWSN